jgi:hypothetical protein
MSHESEKTMPNFTISAHSLEKVPVPIKITKTTVSKELIDVSEQDESQIEPLSNPYRESLNQTEKNILSGATPEPHSILKKMVSTRLLEIK